MTTQLDRGQILSMEAGPELDALVAEYTLGWELTAVPNMGCTDWRESIAACKKAGIEYRALQKLGVGIVGGEVPKYSSDIAAAMRVLEMFWAYGIDWCRGTIPEGTVTIHGRNGEQVSASGDSAPLVICRAALLAKLAG